MTEQATPSIILEKDSQIHQKQWKRKVMQSETK
jgi:hypothetical protein